MLMPKRVKHRKQHRGRMRGMATRGNMLDFGTYAIMATSCGWVTSRQIESARIAMTRHIKRGGQVWIRIFPDKSFTKKPLEQRMGKGKAPVEGWVAVIKPGRIMFEMSGPAVEIAKEAMRLAMHKLPVECKFVTKADFEYGNPLEAKKHGWIPAPEAKAKKKTWEPGDVAEPKPAAVAAAKAAAEAAEASAVVVEPEPEAVPVVEEEVIVEETVVEAAAPEKESE